MVLPKVKKEEEKKKKTDLNGICGKDHIIYLPGWRPFLKLNKSTLSP